MLLGHDKAAIRMRALRTLHCLRMWIERNGAEASAQAVAMATAAQAATSTSASQAARGAGNKRRKRHSTGRGAVNDGGGNAADDDATIATTVWPLDDKLAAQLLRDADAAVHDNDAKDALATFIQTHFLAYVDHIAHILARKTDASQVTMRALSFICCFCCGWVDSRVRT